MQTWQLKSQFCEAEAVDEAGMLTKCVFIIGDGKHFTPFAPAAWVGHLGADTNLPPYLRQLAAEFVCVPFGIGAYERSSAATEWSQIPVDLYAHPEHGFTSSGVWTLLEHDAHSLTMRIDFPAEHDVSHVERTLTLDPDYPAIDFILTLYTRRETQQPVALHPMFRLPDAPADLAIKAEFALGFTDPGSTPKGAEAIIPFQEFHDLAAIPLVDGGHSDYTMLPHVKPIEAMIFLTGARGPFEISYLKEAARVRMTWDHNILPNCMMWASDRSFAPELGLPPIRCVALEPIVAAFGLAPKISQAENPLTTRGIPTVLTLTPDQPTVIHYRIEASAF